MKINCFIIALLIPFALTTTAQETLSFRFANPEIVPGDSPILQFDIELKASSLDTYQRDLQVYIDYNTKAFGDHICKNEKIKITFLNLMEGEIDGYTKYKIIKLTDVSENRIAFLTEFNAENTAPGPGFYNLVPQEFTGLVRVQIEIADKNEKAGIKFVSKLMDGGQYYAKTDGNAYNYDSCQYQNDLTKQSLK